MKFGFQILDDSNAPITGGAANCDCRFVRSADGYMLDFDDNTFKNSGWTTLNQNPTEHDSTNNPGWYYLDIPDAVIVAANDGYYQPVAYYSDTVNRAFGGSLLIANGVVAEENLDAAMSSRAAASVCTEARLAELDAENLPADVLANLAAITALNDISVADILAGVVEGTLTVQQVLRLALAWVSGKTTFADNGDGTYTITFRDNADTKAMITLTVDTNGARTTVSVDVS